MLKETFNSWKKVSERMTLTPLFTVYCTNRPFSAKQHYYIMFCTVYSTYMDQNGLLLVNQWCFRMLVVYTAEQQSIYESVIYCTVYIESVLSSNKSFFQICHKKLAMFLLVTNVAEVTQVTSSFQCFAWCTYGFNFVDIMGKNYIGLISWMFNAKPQEKGIPV